LRYNEEKEKEKNDQDARIEACKKLGFKNTLYLHRFITEGVKNGVDKLINRGIDAGVLMKLGYSKQGMSRLGFAIEQLNQLGFGRPEDKIEREKKEEAPSPDDEDVTPSEKAKHLINLGYRANELKSEGFNLHHCKTAGYSAIDLFKIGFRLVELATEYNLNDLKRAGFGPRELKKFFNGHQLRNAGFTASEMRTAGFSVRDLLNFGYNENQVITAGFRLTELVQEGLSVRTVDRHKMRQ